VVIDKILTHVERREAADFLGLLAGKAQPMAAPHPRG